LTLEQLNRELGTVDKHSVEIFVSDNCSPDDTPEVVEKYASTGSPFRSLRNGENIGSDANIAQCFNLARGKYVLILGDDDLLIDGTIASLISHLQADEYGVVCLRPYGYDRDFRHEYPGGGGKLRKFADAGDFLAAIGPYVTLISSCVINKSLLAGVDARDYCGGNLVQVHLVLQAALRTSKNLFVDDYQIAYKRNNSGGYNFWKVFVEEFGRILDGCKTLGLTDNAIRKIETRMLVSHYPTYLLRERCEQSSYLAETKARFDARFGHRWLYRLWLEPIIALPRPLAIVWGILTTLFGRILFGELRRGVIFARHWISAAWRI
jgi:glycosyltransferase involved in cell wall biosynthesis